jgi:hypothetical protein
MRIMPLKFWVDENGSVVHDRPIVKIALELGRPAPEQPATRPIVGFRVRFKAKGKHWLYGLPWPVRKSTKERSP